MSSLKRSVNVEIRRRKSLRAAMLLTKSIRGRIKFVPAVRNLRVFACTLAAARLKCKSKFSLRNKSEI